MAPTPIIVTEKRLRSRLSFIAGRVPGLTGGDPSGFAGFADSIVTQCLAPAASKIFRASAGVL
jgi:hypothetical protein